jgi:hypothetical protein
MAVGKEAPIPNVCVVAAACRDALSAAVAELTETIASLPPATIKRRLRDAELVLPYANGAVAAATCCPSYTKIEPLDIKTIECKAPEGLTEKI